jgi:hypothetical protein
MTTFTGDIGYAVYDEFIINPESDSYRIRLSNYSGNVGKFTIYYAEHVA